MWEVFTDKWENSRLLRVVLQLGLLVSMVYTGFKMYQVLFNEEEVTVVKEEVKQEEAYGKLPEEIEHIFENPERYDSEDLERAYQVSLTTYDDEFVEKNEFTQDELEEGVYLYHEKVSDHYEKVARLAEEVEGLGVTVYFYTPQNDQSVADLAQHVGLLNEEGTEMIVEAVIVRGEDDIQKIEEEEEVIKYLEGVINANNE